MVENFKKMNPDLFQDNEILEKDNLALHAMLKKDNVATGTS